MVDPKKAGELARAGFDLWQAGRLEESAQKYKEALEYADPEHWGVGDYHGEYAAVLATLGRTGEARRQYELAIAVERRHGIGVGETVSRYFLSDLLLNSNEPHQALEIAQVMPDDASGRWLLHMAQARALWELGRKAESREAATLALERAPNEKKRESIREQLGHILNE
jgi:predicted RNA polymerase sigma factor